MLATHDGHVKVRAECVMKGPALPELVWKSDSFPKD